MKLRPLDDRVVVLPDEIEEKTPGGIFLPDMAKMKPVQGSVLAVGPGRYRGELSSELACEERLPMTVQVGDRVMYNKYSGSELDQDGVTVRVMRESDIFGVLCEE